MSKPGKSYGHVHFELLQGSTGTCAQEHVVHARRHIFRLQYTTTSMLYIPRGEAGYRVTMLPGPQSLRFHFRKPLKPPETPVTAEEELSSRIPVGSSNFASTPDLFECVQQSFVHLCWLCYDLRSRNF
ncbi:hypothetical protein TNCV_2260361 [Trichonephila clavipes]|nr:hypothetical protein TNCV_2260361 [Trichonephila clavipes]